MVKCSTTLWLVPTLYLMPKCLLPRTDSLPFLLYIFPRLICQTFFFLTCFRGDYWNMMCYVKQKSEIKFVW
ncbi:hypothetical protein POPTR_012G007445v4 [Populus trichocarpa]|uniref:Uncharacterized protein n=1 Tax=Populus trichocarpa TaxID=3694 RepID=A0ACC0S560_POPTR|nr:hypothetical protein POPTR_012G007445v4 [Populus trichocarpa]